MTINLKTKRWLYFLCIGLIGIVSSLVVFLGREPLVSPITSATTFQFLSGIYNVSDDSKQVYGFLPYWNLNKTSLHPELTHLGYFGLSIGNDGNLLTQTEEGPEMGFVKMKSDEFLQLVEAAQQQQTKLEVVLTQFDNDAIVSLLSSQAAQENLLTSLDSVLLAYPFEGVNIDIEYSGEVTDTLRQKMVDFMGKLNNHLSQKYSSMPISIDVYSSSANQYTIWDIEQIGIHVDKIIIMAYDFHRRSSPVAGPVAPLFGGKKYWDSDISDHLQSFIKKVPPEKLVLGVPFYGYEWQTTKAEAQAFTYPNTGTTASYKRVQEILDNKKELNAKEEWNEEALSPYIVYQEDDKNYVLYYDNTRSLSYKLDFVNQLDLAGMAIWALGYEGNYQELWDVINRKF